MSKIFPNSPPLPQRPSVKSRKVLNGLASRQEEGNANVQAVVLECRALEEVHFLEDSEVPERV